MAAVFAKTRSRVLDSTRRILPTAAPAFPSGCAKEVHGRPDHFRENGVFPIRVQPDQRRVHHHRLADGHILAGDVGAPEGADVVASDLRSASRLSAGPGGPS